VALIFRFLVLLELNSTCFVVAWCTLHRILRLMSSLKEEEC
jgi:hypothetical protein